MLEIRGLTAGYGGEAVLQDICLDIPEGRVTVIAGPNGCGKSTLLKALAGILPARGSVTFRGSSLLALSPGERARQVAWLPQSRSVPQITAGDLVLHGRFPYLSYPRRYGKQDIAIAEAAMEQMGVLELKHRSMTALSGGQRQKVYIAMALAQATSVVLMDEPNTFLDIAHQKSLMAHARLLAEQGKTVVLVLHDLLMALENADHLVVMEGGTVCAQGTAEQVFSGGVLDQVFGVEVKKTATQDGWRYYYR